MNILVLILITININKIINNGLKNISFKFKKIKMTKFKI